MANPSDPLNDLVRQAAVTIIEGGSISGGSISIGDISVDVAFPLVQTVSFTDQSVTVSNLPASQTVTFSNANFNVLNLPASQTVSLASTSITNFPASQTVSFSNSTVSVSNLPSSQTVSLSSTSITNFPASQTVTLSSTAVTNFPASQTVSGSISVSNFPASQTVSLSSTSITNFPASQTVSLASTSITNFPASQTTTILNAVSSVNSTTVNLGANATFTGTSESTLLFNSVSVVVFSSSDSATDGLVVEQSMDGTNWDIGDYADVKANQAMCLRVNIEAEFVRVQFTNSSTTQTSFRLEMRQNREFHPFEIGRSNAPSKFALLAATNTADTAVIAAPGTSKSIFLRSVDVTNEGISVNRVQLKDGSTKWHEQAIAANGGGYIKNFLKGRKLSVNTAFNVALSSALTNMYINAEYVIQKG